jgi:hypothetical protein
VVAVALLLHNACSECHSVVLLKQQLQSGAVAFQLGSTDKVLLLEV